MSYALIQTGSRQHRVRSGERLRVDLMAGKPGDKVTLERVLAYVDDAGSAIFGKPYIEGCSVTASVVSHGKGRKIRMLKMRRRKNSRRRQGHRQDYTELLIETIAIGGGETTAAQKADRQPPQAKAAEEPAEPTAQPKAEQAATEASDH